MTAAQPTATERHPFVHAVATRDLTALLDALAPEPVLHSAVSGAPFVGREVLADLYASLFESFEEIRIVDEFHGASSHAFFWEGVMEGRFVAGADRLQLDSQGRVREITIVGRPLSGLATFLTGIGFRFARRRRGRLAGILLRLSTLPLPPLFSLLDPVTRWLVQSRRSSRR